MNSKDKTNIAKHANFLLSEWQRIDKKSKGDAWYKVGEKQILLDALRSLEHYKLIKGFDLYKGLITYE